jgi:hypothetical protein
MRNLEMRQLNSHEWITVESLVYSISLATFYSALSLKLFRKQAGHQDLWSSPQDENI